MQDVSQTSDPAIMRTFRDSRIRPIGLLQEATFSGHYSPAYAALASDLQAVYGLPTEIADIIFEAADHVVWTEIPGTRVYKDISFTRRIFLAYEPPPPADGSCPFIDKLPAEIRRKILIDELGSLPSRNRTIHPDCGQDHGVPSPRRNRSNAFVNMMLLSKNIRDEIAEAVYEERTFAIHVHPGFQNAGIEFLHVGRQPLQYLDHIGDGRFTKFRTGEMFGFCRLKKIEIHIFPDEGAYQHSAINTYFMHIALVHLLTRSSEEVDRITSLRIVFQEPDPFKPTAVDSWWDTARDRPRETSIHGISDVELVLRPFALLTHVHKVDVQLPEQVDRHVRSVKFVQSLVRCMTATTLQNTFNSDALESKIESARFALEDHIRRKLYGNGSYLRVPKITDEELDNDLPSQEPEDDDDDNMDITSEGDLAEDQHDSDMDEDQPPHMPHDVSEHAMFDEDGGFPDDLNSFPDDMDVTPNELSQKVARFVECFSVTGDTARLYLELSGDDLESACQLFIDMPDAKKAAASKRPAHHDSPVAPNNHGKSSHPHISSGGPSGAGEADHGGEGKNNKGKQRAYFVDDDGNDDDEHDTSKREDDDDDDNDTDPYGRPDTRQLRASSRDRTSTHEGSAVALWQSFASQEARRSGLQEHLTRFDRPRRRLFRRDVWNGNASSSTSVLFGSDRGRPIERTALSRTSDDSALPNNVRAPLRPSRTVARRDSSASLAANYSEDGQRISEYKYYESPGATTSSAQMAEQRLLYLASQAIATGYATQSMSNDTSSTSRQPGQNNSFASSSRVSNTFGDPQSQLNASMNGDYSLGGQTHGAQSAYPDLSLNGLGGISFATEVFSEFGPLHDPSNIQHFGATGQALLPSVPSAALDSIRDLSNIQHFSTTESNGAAQSNAQWNAGNHHAGGDSNVSVPNAGQYPPDHSSASSPDEAWMQMLLQEILGSTRFDQAMRELFPSVYGHAVPHTSQQSSSSGTNHVAPPSLQHSGLTSGLEDMDVDVPEENVLADAKPKQDADF